MTLGEKLKEARKQAGLSQEQLSEKLRISRSAVAKWETDKGIPDIDNLKALSQLFSVSIDYLVDNGEELDKVKKAQENDKHIKFPQILAGVLVLIAVIIVFYFGGSIIETIFSIGRTLGNAIGDLFWK